MLRHFKPNDLTGRTFDQLTVVSRDLARTDSERWLCDCTCGRRVSRRRDSLFDGNHHSCGCSRRCQHGYARKGKVDPAYQSWLHMMNRCYNHNNTRWKDYGGRGITVCKRWRNFTAFFADMGVRPSGCTLDRRNNDRAYSLNNCRWATAEQQMNNRRNCVYLTYNGKTKSARLWSRETGIPGHTIIKRIRTGWTDVAALTTPVTAKKLTLTYKNETLTLKEWAKRTSIRYKALRYRQNCGWTPEEIIETP
jgi:hypothetical protein